MRRAIVAGFLAAAVLLAAAAVVGVSMLAADAATLGVGCAVPVDATAVPPELVPIVEAASMRFRLGAKGAPILAAVVKIESDFGRNMGPSSAGAIGWTQFLPGTWRTFAVDGDQDGDRDPLSAPDAIFSAARYLAHLGALSNWHAALLGYNHAEWYVDRVLATARTLSLDAGAPSETCAAPDQLIPGDTTRVIGGGDIVPIPGQPGMSIDERILPDVLYLVRRYRLRVTAAFAPTGHKAGGEHPLGLATDLVPGPAGSWNDVDALASWAEPTQNHPRAPFRWVGYDGDSGHGRGKHLHLSWQHAPTPSHTPPAAWVQTLAGPAG